MKYKMYWLRGLLIGLIFGILVTYLHENSHLLLNSDLLRFLIQTLYSLPLLPFSFLGEDIAMVIIYMFQYYLPPLLYGFTGLILGFVYALKKLPKGY